MPTKFEDVYGRAVFRFTDHTFLTTCIELKQEVLEKYLMSAIVDFQPACAVNLSDYDLEAKQFNVDLDNEIIEILGLGIAFYWLSAQVLNRQLLRNIIHNKDYTSYSPGNLLNEARGLRETLEQEYRGKINTYSFRHGSIDKLKV